MRSSQGNEHVDFGCHEEGSSKLVECLAARARELDSTTEWAQQGLEKSPEGSLLVDRTDYGPRFYWRKSPADKKGEYLGNDNDELVRALAQKDYEMRLLKAAEDEKKHVDKLIAFYDKKVDGLIDVYNRLPAARKALVEPYVLNDEEFAQRWQQEEYAGNAHPFGAYSLYTRRGERVRSKSEVLIADALDAAGVPYKYERPLHLGGLNAVYPDFTALNKRTRKEYVWEHFGGMDDPDYREAALQKMNKYVLAGFAPGDALLTTFETANTPLDTRVIETLIQRFLV